MTLNRIVLVFGYIWLVGCCLAGAWGLSATIAEIVLSIENRILLAFKVQKPMIKYFRNRKEIDKILDDLAKENE